MIRIVSLIISIVLVFSVFPAAFAQTAPLLEITTANEEITELLLTVDSAWADKSVLLRVFEKGKEETLNNLLWAEEGKVNALGSCEFEVLMSGFESGKTYRFIASVRGQSDTPEDEVIFYSKSEKALLWTRIKSAIENKTDSEILWVIENRGDYLQLDTQGYNEQTAPEGKKDEFYRRLYAAKSTSLDDFVEDFNFTITLMEFSAASAAEAENKLENILEVCGLKTSSAYLDYSANSDLKSVVFPIIHNAEINANGVKQALDTAVVLQLLKMNKQLWNGYASVLYRYKTEIGLDLSVYDGMENQSAVITQLQGKTDDFKTLADVKKAFEDVCRPEDGDSSGGNEGNNGNGGGGGGGGKISPPKITDTTDTNVDKETQKEETVLQFSDMGQAVWAKEAVSYLVERGILNGVGNGNFVPNRQVTRAEVAKMLVLASNAELVKDGVVFDDVKADAWYAPYIKTAYSCNIIKGISETTFAPDQFITRQDLALMVSRILETKSVEAQISFDDEGEISDYALEAVKLLSGSGIINGKGNNLFDPHAGATRAETAKMLFEVLKYGGGVS